MTAQDIFNRFTRLLQETSTRFFNSALSGAVPTSWGVEVLNDSISDIYEEMRAINPEFVGMTQYQLGYVLGQREYSLPSGVVSIVKVEVNDLGGPPYPTLQAIDFRQVGVFIVPFPTLPQLAAGGQGEPTCFYVRQSEPSSGVLTIGFDPIPYRNATNNINVWYSAYPAQVTAIDSEIPDLPPDLHRLLALRMCVLACMADSSPRLPAYAQLYEGALQKAVMLAGRSRQGGREEFNIVDVF